MLFFVFGSPGRFSQWCEAVVAGLAGRGGGPVASIRADTLEQIARAALGIDAAHVVVSSVQPGGRLRAALVEHRRKFIVALDAPLRALRDVAGRGDGFASAVQQVASACAVLDGLVEVPGALVLDGVHSLADREGTVGAIARHLDIAIDESEIAELVDRLAANEPPGARQDETVWWNQLDDRQRDLASGALMPFVANADRGALTVVWGFDLFFFGEHRDQRVTGPIDITGRARCLLQGPHIALPPGTWAMSLEATLWRDATEHEFVVEIRADRTLASDTLRPTPDGRAEISLDFVLDDTVEHPIAVRLESRRAAFDGGIIDARVTLTRASATEEIHADLEARAEV